MKDILFSPTLLFCHRSALKSDKINAHIIIIVEAVSTLTTEKRSFVAKIQQVFLPYGGHSNRRPRI